METIEFVFVQKRNPGSRRLRYQITSRSFFRNNASLGLKQEKHRIG
jgi:hypothetical protein